MGRMIDADAFLERNKEFADRDFNHPKYEDTLRELVDEEPTVDAVEVVRCRDCKHLSNDRIAPEFNRVCRLYGCGKKEYGFCDEGERRNDGR